MRLLRPLIQAISIAYVLLLSLYLLLRLLPANPPWWVNALHNFAPYYFVPLLLIVPLALLAHTHRGVLAALSLLMLVATAWFGPRFFKLTPVQAGTDADTITLVTFNTMRGEPDPEAFVSWIREVNPDVINLQEMRVFHLTHSWETMDRLSLRYPYRSQLTYAQAVWWGNYVLMRYPILEVDAPVAEAENLPFYVRMVMNFKGREVAVYNVHVSSPLRETDTESSTQTNNVLFNLAMRFDSTVRNTQLQRLLDDLSRESLPYIVMGDFNTSDNDPFYTRLSAAMHDSFAEAGQGLGTTWPVAATRLNVPEVLPTLVRIDYVWHSDHFRAVEAFVGPRLGSDHLPLVVTLAWNEDLTDAAR
jgi:vancomycin resistance protein VanJ